jgi:HEAT repeat protein
MPVAELKSRKDEPEQGYYTKGRFVIPVVEKKTENPEIAALMVTLEKGNTYGSLQAATALGRIGAPAVGPLVQALTDDATTARWRIAIALACVGTAATEALIGVVNAGKDPAVNPAIWALGRIGDPRAVEPLVAAMKCGRTESCRGLAAAALMKLGHPAGVAAVEEALPQADETVRAFVFEEVHRN